MATSDLERFSDYMRAFELAYLSDDWHAPTGKTADLPFVSVFTYKDGALRGERFFFDLATLCDQIGLPIAAMRGVVGALRTDHVETAHAAVGG